MNLNVFLEHAHECDSTMNLARELALKHPHQFGLITAERQTAGRGRRGNSWSTLQSGFAGTIWIKSDFDAQRLSGLSLAAGVLVIRVLQRLGFSAWLKWPNDIVTLDARKVGGILVEVVPARAVSGSENVDTPVDTLVGANNLSQHVLIGIGLNVRTSNSLGLKHAGVKDLLDESGCVPRGIEASDAQLAKSIGDGIVANLGKFWQEFSESGVSQFLPEWRDSCIIIGNQVEFSRGQCREQNGITTRERGVFVDVGPGGEAVLEVNGQIERFFSGEIHTVRRAL